MTSPASAVVTLAERVGFIEKLTGKVVVADGVVTIYDGEKRVSIPLHRVERIDWTDWNR